MQARAEPRSYRGGLRLRESCPDADSTQSPLWPDEGTPEDDAIVVYTERFTPLRERSGPNWRARLPADRRFPSVRCPSGANFDV